jgi:H+/Cl- antiporter ClcA
MIPHWTQLAPYEWSLLIAAAAGIGLSKSGFAGVSMLHVIAFAFVFGAKASTGILLPLLVIGDCCAIVVYRPVETSSTPAPAYPYRSRFRLSMDGETR